MILGSSVFVPAPAQAATTGRGGLYFGTKSLNNSDWGPLDSQAAWGVNLDVKDEAWPVWIAAGYMTSRDRETLITSLSPYVSTEIEGKTTEVRLGLKKDFLPLSRVLLSLSGGPAYMSGELESSVAPFNSDADSTVGAWAGADIIFNLRFVSLGVSYLYSSGTIKLFGNSVEVGGSNLAFSIGFGW
jgi:hypothetical protein